MQADEVCYTYREWGVYFFAATRFRSVLVFRMDSVEKSTVASRHILLLLLCSKALMQREGGIREDGNSQTGCQGT